jgi:hypothetical protein
MNLPIGYFLCVANFSFIALPCLFGAVLEYKTENFLSKLEEVSWERLSTSDQKSFNVIIQFAQRIGSITCFIIPLNQNAMIAIYNKIYSYVLMLSSFDED